MSELEKTAPNEIYLIVGDTDKDCNFNELSEVTWADMPIYEETAIKYIKSYHLTIPKSIADDKVVKYAVEHPNLARFVINDILEGLAIDEYPIDYENVIKWIKPLINVDRDKLNVILAYLSGKALGVDLVKVVEG